MPPLRVRESFLHADCASFSSVLLLFGAISLEILFICTTVRIVQLALFFLVFETFVPIGTEGRVRERERDSSKR